MNAKIFITNNCEAFGSQIYFTAHNRKRLKIRKTSKVKIEDFADFVNCINGLILSSSTFRVGLKITVGCYSA